MCTGMKLNGRQDLTFPVKEEFLWVLPTSDGLHTSLLLLLLASS